MSAVKWASEAAAQSATPAKSKRQIRSRARKAQSSSGKDETEKAQEENEKGGQSLARMEPSINGNRRAKTESMTESMTNKAKAKMPTISKTSAAIMSKTSKAPQSSKAMAPSKSKSKSKYMTNSKAKPLDAKKMAAKAKQTAKENTISALKKQGLSIGSDAYNAAKIEMKSKANAEGKKANIMSMVNSDSEKARAAPAKKDAII
jgi:hypothetical protein